MTGPSDSGIQVEWVPFDKALWASQAHPPERKLVLVQRAAQPEKGLPPAVAVGYLRYAAGCKDSPYFVCPGVGGETAAWCDCLPEGFGAPLWPGFPVAAARRAALPVAPSDEPHPPSRHCMCAACRPSFDDDAPLPVAALSDERIYALALEHGIEHGVIPNDEFQQAIGTEPGTRWTAEEVRPEQTIAFARALLAQGALSDADRELMEQMLAVIEMAQTGLEWYREHCPDQVNGSDNEADEQIETAITALRTRLLRHSEGKAE